MEKHTRNEDYIAMLTGCLLVTQGLFFLQSANLLTGGTAGLALLMTHVLPVSFGTVYFLVNLPFYWMAWQRFGRRFALNSLLCGALVSLMSEWIPTWLHLDQLHQGYCALAGGLLMGIGMLILFRHRASLGGFNVLCLMIQDRFGLSVGKSQVIIDAGILIASGFFIAPMQLAMSVFGVVILNAVLAMNHKPKRYTVNYS